MTSTGPGTSTAELVQALQQDVAALVRREVRAVQEEMTGKAAQAGRGAALLGGAAITGALAAGTSAALFLRALDTFLPRPASALVLTTAYGAAAGALAAAGVAELRRSMPLVPEETVDQLKTDVQAGTSG
jgi:Putative Actinobacterial Holin-X, holin superfamily III